MKVSQKLARLKPWMLPIAMVCGLLFHNAIDSVQFLAPYLIFAMLLITFCRINPAEFRITSLTWGVVGAQVIGGIAAYFALEAFDKELAEGTMICILCPTATAAPVITAMLGGSIAVLVAISILSNVAFALIGPAFLAYINEASNLTFGEAFIVVAEKVGPMILGPLALAFLLKWLVPKVHDTLADHQSVSFYIWAVSLILVVGRAVNFAMAEPADRIGQMLWLALLAGIACIAQFAFGRWLGRRWGDKIAGAQGLGQKNTVLAVWMATTYLNPISSIAPAAYIAWQNTINSLQIYKHKT